MKRLTTFVALTAICGGLLAPSARLDAYTFSTDVGGCGYQECRSCVVLAPAVALAAVALAAIIAVALQTNNNNHSH